MAYKMHTKSFILHSDFSPSGDQPQAITQLIEGLENGLAHQTLLGVTGSGKTFTIANVIAKLNRPAMVLAPNKTLAAQLYAEMKAFFQKMQLNISYLTMITISQKLMCQVAILLLRKMRRLMIKSNKCAYLPLNRFRASRYYCGCLGIRHLWFRRSDSYLKMMLHLQTGAIINQRQILAQLAELQYTRNDQAFERGTFRVRGEIIDIFPAESDDKAIRIELFDDEIERLSLFDPLTGSSFGPVPRYTIYPKTHYVTPRERILDAIEKSNKNWRSVANSYWKITNYSKNSALHNAPNSILK